MKYIQALKEQGYNFKALPTDIQKAIKLVLKSKDYNSKIDSLDFITFNSIRNSQPVDERIEELHKLSLTDHSVENNNGFNTPLSIEIVEQEFASGGHIATKDDNNKVRNWKVRFHLGKGENFLHWKIENPKTKEVQFYNPDKVQIEMFNCKLTNSPATALKIFTGKVDKSPIAWVVCEKYKISKTIDPVDSDERLTYNPRTAPNWFDTDGDNVDNYVFEKLITFGRGVYYEAPDGKLFALGGISDQEELHFAGGGQLLKRADGSYSQRGLWDNIRANIGSGKEPTPEMLEQESKINQKYSGGGSVSSSRARIPNVRGGWTKDKIIKYFKEYGSDTISTPTLAKYISQFDNWQDFKNHIYYHGTTNYIEKGLKPSIAFSERWAEQQGGGGYGERYFGVSLTKRKRTAEAFAGQSSGVTIYPVILKKDARVIERTDFEDASDVEDIIVELYEQGVDAVWIGGGEEELVVINPYAILLYKNGKEYHSAYGGFKSVALTDEKIKEIYDNSLQVWEDFLEVKRQELPKEEFNQYVSSLPPIQFETGGATKKTGKDIYENDILQIRIIGSEPNYYKRVNQEWKFLSPEMLEKLKTGTRHELEHSGTIEAFKRRDIPNEIIASFIAYDHINEDVNYYEKLDKAIPEQMARGKKIDIPVVFKQTLGDYKIWIEEVKSTNGEVFYSGEVYLKDMLLKIFPAVSSDIEELKKIMRNYIEKIQISANENAKNIIFIDGKSNKVSESIYKYVLSKMKPSVKQNKTDSLRHAVEETISAGQLSQGTQLSKYDDIDTLRSKMLEILRNEEGDNSYTTPYSWEALMDLKTRAYHQMETQKAKEIREAKRNYVQEAKDYFLTSGFIDELNTDERYFVNTLLSRRDTPYRTDDEIEAETYFIREHMIDNLTTDKKFYVEKLIEHSKNKKPLPEVKENKMEKDMQTGSVANWNEVPVRWKNVKAVRPMSFSLNPYDKGLNTLIKDFIGDDALRPVMTGMNFSESGVVCTDAHKLIHIHYKHSDFKGNYATANTMKALKGSRWTEGVKDLQEATDKIKEDRFPNWEAVVPRENPFVYEVDIMKLYQYLNVAINYANKTTKQVAFRFDNGKAIGFNAKFLMQGLEAMMKMQKCTKVFLHLSDPNRAMLITYEKSITPTGNTFVLLMPVMVHRAYEQKITQVFGAYDPDFEKSLSCYFDFEDGNIHNGDGSIADYKESYGDAGEMPLALITMLDKFIKIGKTRVTILENVCVDGNGIRVDSIDTQIEIANDWNLPQGLYRIEKNAMVRNTLNGDVEDFPKLRSRVSTSDPVFTMDSEAFKFYIAKAFEHCGDDDLRPMMKCILLENNQLGHLQMVSTDAHSLFHVNITRYASQVKKENFSYPIDFTKQLINFAKNIDSKEVKFYVDGNDKYRIDAGRLHFESKMGDGKYPNWEAVIPKQYSNQLYFDIKDLYVCLNNEVAKTFAKKEDLKPDDICFYNQDDKIFISNFVKGNYENEKHIETEVCSIKIKKETFNVDQSFSATSQNYVLLMPQTWTNGNYFNFKLLPFSDVVASLGKDKVFASYSDLNKAYIFTSDNLDYKTSDVYKPEKAITTPVKSTAKKQSEKIVSNIDVTGIANRLKQMDKLIGKSNKTTNTDAYHRIIKLMPKNWNGRTGWDAVAFEYAISKGNSMNVELVREVDALLKGNVPVAQNSQLKRPTDKSGRTIPTPAELKLRDVKLPEVSDRIKEQIMLVEKQHNMKYDKTLMKQWDTRYISARRKLYPDWQELEKVYGKPLSAFKVGDVIGTTARNTDSDSYVIVEISKDGKAYIFGRSYAYPSVSEHSSADAFWELIEPKQDLIAGAKIYPETKVIKPAPKQNLKPSKETNKELKDAIKGLEAFLFSFGATKTKANLEESLAVQSAIKGLKALLK